MIEIISLIVTVSSAIYTFVNDTKISDDTDRYKIASFLNKIAETLETVADKLSIDEVPHGACDALRAYAIIFPEVVGEYMAADKALEYANMLLSAHNVEMLILQTRTDKPSIELIRLAAWRFSVASELLKLQTKKIK